MLIDTRGPEGNAFAIMGLVQRLLREVGRADEIQDVLDDMKSGDYRHLCEVATRVSHGSIEFDFHEDEEEEENE